MTRFLSRRQALRSILAAPASAILAERAHAAEVTPAAADQPPGQCRLLPQAVEGPYYFDPKLVRSDIAEGRPGIRLRLELRIIESGTCAPIPNARVDVWHADAQGIYSGYSGQGPNYDTSTKGESFLRGTQMTDEDGRVKFKSIYPGWYPGRTPHIHVKVFIGETRVATAQVYFPDEFSARIYTTYEPYNLRSISDTTNDEDSIFRDGERDGGGTVLAVNQDGDTVSAGLLIGVDQTGEAANYAERGFLRRMLGL
ncbi:intradiol ring-cleavage dioxygenase [Hyphomicrobium denitrificans 1NES1]|uniref:Intradiol ring-cleavage dioxygenase n=1 Tax=Hyphomicrobium denitrificans 1NES1 TaxID=670307 RepID=N0B6D5_9HYPH|nr:intradiol ring-cleavage dioxygenase [Hyphomicrobium denitrificans]AGK58553.1 intradiol ring-cleavage dioxygenase [Hyphomicrobium denitrificans 1NES1]